jgi:TRAP-type C4-dicarboxylate transport system substrate-binding protein
MEAAEASVEAERASLYAQEEEYKKILMQDGGRINLLNREPFIEAAVPYQNEAAEEYGVTELLEQIRELK